MTQGHINKWINKNDNYKKHMINKIVISSIPGMWHTKRKRLQTYMNKFNNLVCTTWTSKINYKS